MAAATDVRSDKDSRNEFFSMCHQTVPLGKYWQLYLVRRLQESNHCINFTSQQEIKHPQRPNIHAMLHPYVFSPHHLYCRLVTSRQNEKIYWEDKLLTKVKIVSSLPKTSIRVWQRNWFCQKIWANISSSVERSWSPAYTPVNCVHCLCYKYTYVEGPPFSYL